MKMKQRSGNGLTYFIFLSIIFFVFGFWGGLKVEKVHSNYEIEDYKKKIAMQEQLKEIEEEKEDELILEQRKQYFDEIKPIKFYGVDFYQEHKKYQITTPQKIYKDYDCSEEVKDPVITSTNVVEIIMNEEYSRYGLRTEGNKLVWVKEEPRIEEVTK